MPFCPKISRHGEIAALLLCLALACQAQSLGDVARQQKLKKSAASPAERRVITNEDIQSSGTASAATGGTAKEQGPAPTGSAAKTSTDKSATTKDSRPSAEEVKEEVRAQKQKVSLLEAQIKDLQRELEKWKGVDCSQYVDQEGRSWCEILRKRIAEIDRLKSKLEQERKTVEDMQEAARRLGYGNAVYDPD